MRDRYFILPQHDRVLVDSSGRYGLGRKLQQDGLIYRTASETIDIGLGERYQDRIVRNSLRKSKNLPPE